MNVACLKIQLYPTIRENTMKDTVVHINDNLSVDIELLRTQRNSLLEILECVDGSKPDLLEDFFGLDKQQAFDALNGVTNFLDAVLDDVELGRLL